MRALWMPAPPPEPEDGTPALPGSGERLAYRGLTFQRESDYELWNTWFDDRWELAHQNSDEPVLLIRAEEDEAIVIATRLAEARDWSGDDAPDWLDLSLDPAILSIMAEYQGKVIIPAAPIPNRDEWEDDVPYGDA